VQSSAPKQVFTRGRVWDVLALLVVAFALWKLFIAPRSFAPRTLVAPNAVYERLNGGTFRVADQRGRTLFLDFFASWCAPCKVELPIVQAWANNHPDAVVVPVDVGEPRLTVAAFAQRLHVHGVVIDPHSSARALFSVSGFPTVVVIDSAGYIRAKWEGLNPAIALALSNAEKKLPAAP
jgi:thiol-disulfide isomerase/thioredoxin